MSVVDAVARVAQLQGELASLRTPAGQSTSSAGADAFAALLGAVSSTPATVATASTTSTGQAAAAPAAASGAQVTGQQIVQDAEQYLGVPYVFGGESTSGMDCSGLVQKVLGDLGISAPRVVPDQATIGTPVASLAEAQPGDLIVEKGNGHIQIYAGDGQIIEAPKPGENVVKRKEWLSADQIGTIRRVATSAQEPAAAATPGADAGAQLSALLAPVLMQQSTLAAALTGDDSDDDGSAAASLAGPTATSATSLASLAAALLPGMPGGTDAAAATASTAAPAAPAAPVPSPALSQQLSGPITQLVTQPDGSHTVVVRVVPEQLGPVTVDAHLTDHGLRIELSAPNDAGRDALNGVLGELRRDLAAGGITASVSLGSTSTSSSGGDGQSQAGAQQALFELFDEQRSGRVGAPAASAATAQSPSALLSPDSLLDVLA